MCMSFFNVLALVEDTVVVIAHNYLSQHNIVTARYGPMGTRSATASDASAFWGLVAGKSCTLWPTRLHEIACSCQLYDACPVAMLYHCSPKMQSKIWWHAPLLVCCLWAGNRVPFLLAFIKMGSKQMESVSSPSSGLPTGCALWWRAISCHCLDTTVIELQTQLAVRTCWLHMATSLRAVLEITWQPPATLVHEIVPSLCAKATMAAISWSHKTEHNNAMWQCTQCKQLAWPALSKSPISV